MNLWFSPDPVSVSQRNGSEMWEALLRWTVFIIIFVNPVVKRIGLSETHLGSHTMA